MGAGKSKKKKEKQPAGPVEYNDGGATKKVDPRLPFTTYRQVFALKNSWKAVTRAMGDVSKETMIRHFDKHPEQKDWFPRIKNMTDPEVMRNSTVFEEQCSDIFSVYDDVMENIENVDMALFSLKQAAGNPNNKELYTSLRAPFMRVIEETLDNRWNEKTSDNFNLLYDFILQEMKT